MVASILDSLNVPRELTLEFLATFARFEFALKKAGYAHGDDSKVSPDWDSFAKDLAKLDAAVLAPVLNACQYLQQHPPKKQILQNGVLHWVVRQGTSGSAIGDVLLSVRAIRNNLFHGGKFPDGVITDPLRDEQLICDCLAVLKGLLGLALPKDVANIFKEGIAPANRIQHFIGERLEAPGAFQLLIHQMGEGPEQVSHGIFHRLRFAGTGGPVHPQAAAD